MKLNFKWVKRTGQFQTGERLFLNSIEVGGYDWNGIAWVGTVDLLSWAEGNVSGDTEREIKDKLESFVQEWFEEALKEDEVIRIKPNKEVKGER